MYAVELSSILLALSKVMIFSFLIDVQVIIAYLLYSLNSLT
jgi:hypothetical protein